MLAKIATLALTLMIPLRLAAQPVTYLSADNQIGIMGVETTSGDTLGFMPSDFGRELSLSADGQFIFFGDSLGGVGKFATDASSIELIYAPFTEGQRISRCNLDIEGQDLYCRDSGGNLNQYATTQATSPIRESILPVAASFTNFEVVTALDTVFFSDRPTEVIGRCNLDGTGLTTLYTDADGVVDPEQIQYAAPSDELYWNRQRTEAIDRAPASGIGPIEAVPADIPSAFTNVVFDLDPPSRERYVSVSSEIAVETLLGLASTTLYDASDGVGFVRGLIADVGNNIFYFLNDNVFSTAPLDGTGSVTPVFGRDDFGLSQVGGFAYDNANQIGYWISLSGVANFYFADFSTNSLPLRFGPVVDPDEPTGLQFDDDERMLYWAEAGAENAIRRVSVDPPSVIETLYDAADGINVVGDLFLDVVNDMVYWIQPVEGLIFRAPQDGSGASEQLVDISGSLFTLAAVAVDPVNNRLYWGQNGPRGGYDLFMMDLSNRVPMQVFNALNTFIDIDIRDDGRVFWSDTSVGEAGGVRSLEGGVVFPSSPQLHHSSQPRAFLEVLPLDLCLADPDKTEPGVCGCGVPDVDSDSDTELDCNDECPNDASKVAEGVCGCGTAETDSDADGSADCIDSCAQDPNKISPGTCGCGAEELDSNNDGTIDCGVLPPEECSATPFTEAKLAIDGSAESLRRVGLQALQLERRLTNQAVCQEPLSVRVRRELRRELSEQYDSVWNITWTVLPAEQVSCEGDQPLRCTSVDLTGIKTDISNGLRQLRRSVMSLLRNCGSETRRGRKLLRKARDRFRAAQESVQNLPDSTLSCEG